MNSKGWKIREPDGIYFLTFTTVQWVDVFTRLEHRLVLLESLEYCQINKGLEIFAWVIMSNHIHLVVRSKENFKLSDTIRDFKKFTSVKIKRQINTRIESRRSWMKDVFETAGKNNKNNWYFQLWQQKSHPVLLSTNYMLKQRINYTHNNPVKAGIVLEPHYYLYSSSSNYADLGGLLKVNVLQL